ncbi:hypothetical protein F5884DRAFT_755497 [Xylogone sp. PMI_703]|nr:hypothetical protein F5884DRAFT_755497 [Xylogone sp. PMI_703]
MPNWKTYESSVRLLAAIIAAHPGLKLNYEETAKYYGDGAGYKTIWSRCAKIKETAQAFRDAVDEGKDPHTVSIDEAAKASPLKTKGANGEGRIFFGSHAMRIFVQLPALIHFLLDIAVRFGGDCTKSALENRFRRIKADAKRMNDAVARGIDPVTLIIGAYDVKDSPSSQGQKLYQFVLVFLSRNFCLLSIKTRDTLVYEVLQAGIAKHFGSDCTKSGIEWQFRAIKAGARLQVEAVKAGADPKDVNIATLKGGNDSKEIALYYDDCTASALEHRFRPIKKQAAELRSAIAKKYGEGVTAKAISTRFERLKKEPHANLENSFNENESTPKSARVRGTPKSGGKKAASVKMDSFSTVDNMTQGTSEDDEDELYQSFPSTPSKKPSINKVQSGRIMKSKPPSRPGQAGGITTPYILDDDNDAIKAEMSGFNMSGANLADHYQVEQDNMNMASFSHARMDMGGMGIGNGMGLSMMMGDHQYVVDYDDEHEA